VPLAGSASHTLTAGATGAGKNSVMWCPLVAIAPAIRDGLVRVSGIDPKGMELAYGRRIFHRYAVTGADALALLDDLVAAMADRKATFAGQVRTVPISPGHPLELRSNLSALVDCAVSQPLRSGTTHTGSALSS
jgi:DNA segregation ATPase FtsK/SpoIIIE, S-DNA-T family